VASPVTHCFTGYDTRRIVDSVIAFLRTALSDPRDKQ
jgi:hypothetical protein